MKETTLRKLLKGVWMNGYHAGWDACSDILQYSSPRARDMNEDFNYEVNHLIANFDDVMAKDKK